MGLDCGSQVAGWLWESGVVQRVRQNLSEELICGSDVGVRACWGSPCAGCCPRLAGHTRRGLLCSYTVRMGWTCHHVQLLQDLPTLATKVLKILLWKMELKRHDIRTGHCKTGECWWLMGWLREKKRITKWEPRVRQKGHRLSQAGRNYLINDLS